MDLSDRIPLEFCQFFLVIKCLANVTCVACGFSNVVTVCKHEILFKFAFNLHRFFSQSCSLIKFYFDVTFLIICTQSMCMSAPGKGAVWSKINETNYMFVGTPVV